MSGVLNNPRTTAEPSLKTSLTDVVCFGPFAFDRVNGLLSRGGHELALPPRAVGVLARLIDRAGDVVSKAELLDHVWKDTFVTEVSLTEAVSLLRQTLDDDAQRPTYIQTLPRRGYRFLAPLDRGAEPARLGALRAALSETPAAPVESVQEVWPGWLPWMVSGVVTIALVAVSMGLLRQPTLRERPVARFAIDPGVDVVPQSTEGPAVAISRDGARLVFVGRRSDGRLQLFVRDLARLDVVPLPGTDGARAPFFSPDGRSIGFFANGRLQKGALAGGDPITLCLAPTAGGATWTPQGSIVFAGAAFGGLSRVAETGGRVERLTTPEPNLGEVRHLWPVVLPSGAGIVFTGWPADDAPESARVAVASLDGRDVASLVDGASFGRALSTGHLLFLREGSVLAAPFDVDALVVQGPAVPVLATVASVPSMGVAQFAVAAPGVLALATTSGTHARETWRWLNQSTRAVMPFEGQPVRSFAFDPASNRVAAAVGDGHRTDVWVGQVDPNGSRETRVIRLTTSGYNASPVWRTDGSALVLASRDDGPFNLFLVPADGRTAAVRLTSSTRNQMPWSVSTAGSIVYSQSEEASGMDLWAMALPPSRGSGEQAGARPSGPHGARLLAGGPGDQVRGVVAPDGRWLAYQSNASGRWHALVQAMSSDGPTPRDLGESDGQTLAWTTPDRVLFVDAASHLRECRLSEPTGVECTTRAEGVGALAGVASDPSKGALVRDAEPSSTPQLQVVLEWSKELSARVPVRPKEVRPAR